MKEIVIISLEWDTWMKIFYVDGNFVIIMDWLNVLTA